jgi:hypothetical protein
MATIERQWAPTSAPLAASPSPPVIVGVSVEPAEALAVQLPYAAACAAGMGVDAGSPDRTALRGREPGAALRLGRLVLICPCLSCSPAGGDEGPAAALGVKFPAQLIVAGVPRATTGWCASPYWRGAQRRQGRAARPGGGRRIARPRRSAPRRLIDVRKRPER